MTMKNLLCASALALVASGTLAAAQTDGAGIHATTVEGPHAKMTVVTGASRPSIAAPNDNGGGLVTIFNSLASKYPKGEYWCCSGYNVMGPGQNLGEQWMGGGFTPSADHTVTRIEVAVGYSQQGTNGVVVSLNADNGGVPGAALKTWNVSGLSTFGTCCAVVVVKDKTGIPISVGQQYWVVLSTNDKEKDTVDGWNVSDADQLDNGTFASYSSNTWHIFQTAPGLAFAVKGSN